MEKIAYLPLGSRSQAQVVKINSTKSAKLGMYSTIVSFFQTTDTALGRSVANRGFFGIMLTEKDPKEVLKVGDVVDVQIASYRTSDFNGQENTAAQVSFIALSENQTGRISVANPVSNQGTKINA
jgi:hypothetical protein